jgi:hypothetical protein
MVEILLVAGVLWPGTKTKEATVVQASQMAACAVHDQHARSWEMAGPGGVLPKEKKMKSRN